MTTKELYAYAAGFIDGEGYIGMVKRYDKTGKEPFYAVPCVKTASTDFEVLDFMEKHFDGYISKDRFDKKCPNGKASRMWEIRNRKQVFNLLDKIYPYLIIKKERAKIVLDFIKECGSWRQNSIPEERRIEIYQLMRKLNFRGLATTECVNSPKGDEATV